MDRKSLPVAEVIPSNTKISCLVAFSICLFFALIITVAILCTRNYQELDIPEFKDDNVNSIVSKVKEICSNIKETFSDENINSLYKKYAPTLPEGNIPIQQPGVFLKQVNSYSKNCMPYSGCFYPSFLSNPLSLKSGMREKAPEQNKVWCEQSWRDCGIYQDCVDGQCAPKKNVYPE